MRKKSTIREPLLSSNDDTDLTVQSLTYYAESNVLRNPVDEVALSQMHSIFPQYDRMQIQNILLQNRNDITMSMNILMDEEQKNKDYMFAKTLESQ